MKDKKILAQAYLDGELSIEEVIRFEEKLSNEQKDELAAEFSLEKSIASKISQPVQCPDILWKKIKGGLQKKKSNSKIFSYAKLAAIVLLSITLILFISQSLPKTNTRNIHNIYDDIDVCKNSVDIPGNVQTVNDVLSAKGFPIPKKCFSLPKLINYHKIDFLGASMIEQGDAKGVKLYFVCCMRPVTVFITHKNSSMLENLYIKKDDKTYYQITKVTHAYRIIAVGTHNPEDVLALF